MGSRAEGSAAEAATFDYIERFLRDAGVDTASSDFGDAQDGYSTSRIVEAKVKGARDDELALIVPVNRW